MDKIKTDGDHKKNYHPLGANGVMFDFAKQRSVRSPTHILVGGALARLVSAVQPAGHPTFVAGHPQVGATCVEDHIKALGRSADIHLPIQSNKHVRVYDTRQPNKKYRIREVYTC